MGLTRGDGYGPFRLLVHMELENVRPRVMADDIQIILAPDDLPAIDLGGQNRLIFPVRPGQKVAKRVNDATATARDDRFGIAP